MQAANLPQTPFCHAWDRLWTKYMTLTLTQAETMQSLFIYIIFNAMQFKNVLIKSAQVLNNKFPIMSGEYGGFWDAWGIYIWAGLLFVISTVFSYSGLMQP